MPQKHKVKITYENAHEEEFSISSTNVVSWTTAVEPISISDRRELMNTVERLRLWLSRNSGKKLEVEEEEE